MYVYVYVCMQTASDRTSCCRVNVGGEESSASAAADADDPAVDVDVEVEGS